MKFKIDKEKENKIVVKNLTLVDSIFLILFYLKMSNVRDDLTWAIVLSPYTIVLCALFFGFLLSLRKRSLSQLK